MTDPIEQLKAEIIQLRMATQHFYFILESIIAQMLMAEIDEKDLNPIKNEMKEKIEEYFAKYGKSGATILDEEKDFLIKFAAMLYDEDKKLHSLLEGKNTSEGGNGRGN